MGEVDFVPWAHLSKKHDHLSSGGRIFLNDNWFVGTNNSSVKAERSIATALVLRFFFKKSELLYFTMGLHLKVPV